MYLATHSVLLILSAEWVDIIQVTTLIAIIVGNKADRPHEEQSLRGRGPL